MGCGISRPNAEGEAIPTKSHPIVCCQIEEIRRRRRSSRATKDTTGKELFLVGKQANKIDRNAQKRASSSPKDSIIPSCVTSEDSKGREKSAKAENKEDEKEKKGVKGADKAEERGKDHVDDDNEGDSDEGDEGMIEASMNFPGSPSFRIYFKGNSGDDHDNDNDGGKKDQANDKAQNSEQSTSPKEAKKGRKRRSLKKSLSKGGHNSVENYIRLFPQPPIFFAGKTSA